MNEDFFGIKREEEPVQDLYAEEREAKAGRNARPEDGAVKKVFGRRGGGGMGGSGKILSIAIVLSLLIALACSWFMVQMFGATRSDVNGVITTVNGLSTQVGEIADTALTPADLDGLATEAFVTGKGYTTVTSVDSKISSLNTSLMGYINALGGGNISTGTVTAGPKITVLAGGCNINLNGSCATGNITSGQMWSKSFTNWCVLNLTATSDTTHTYYGTFDHWVVNGLNYTVNPITVNVSGETTIAAVSTGVGNIISYTLTYTAGANGYISGTTPQTVYRTGNGTQITAVANSGYAFANWSDLSTANPRTDTNVLNNIAVTANFASCAATAPTGMYPASGNISIGSYTGIINWSDCNTNSYTLTILGIGEHPCFNTYSPSVSQYTFAAGVNTSYYCTINAYGCSGTPVQATSWMFNVIP